MKKRDKMSCDFCDEQASVETIYNRIYGERSRLVYETENFCIVPCMGQLREGHFLIYSKEHINSIGAIDSNGIVELNFLIDRVSKYLKLEYHLDTICFEHGVLSDDGQNGGCGISHMHLHLLPGTSTEYDELLKSIVEDDNNVLLPVTGISDTSKCVGNNQTYVYLSHMTTMRENSSYILTNQNNYFESQYMRKKIAGLFGIEVWDWKKILVPEKMFLNTLSRAEQHFSIC